MNSRPLALLPLLFSLSAAADGYAVKPADQYGRSRDFDLQTLSLDLDLDVRGKKISGVSTMTFAPLRDGAGEINIDSAELQIDEVSVDGAPADAQKTPDGLAIRLAPPRPAGKTFTLKIRYRGRPRKGIHFVLPDDGYPGDPVQAWTQGEAEDSRYWFPSYDYPNDKTNTETTVRVDDDLTVVSNGALIGTRKVGGKKEFHYRQKVPHTTYLVSIVAGKFDVVEDKSGKVPLLYYVPPGYGKRAKEIFGRTPDLVSWFEKITGEPYPYEKYAQTVAANYTHGGMENTSATTLTDYFLYPEKAREDLFRRGDGLIAHELAHQWFGDLLTCESWNHLWLNEGFATYFGTWSAEKTRNKEEFALEMSRLGKAVFAESPRATVAFRFIDPDSLFDQNVYARGAWLLHMLRMQLGDDLFLRGLRAYVKEFREKTVETADFRRVLERETGVNLSRFFDEWVFRPGWMQLKGKWSWDADAKAAVVSLEQKEIMESGDRFYTADLPIEFETAKGPVRRTLPLSGKEAKVSFPLDERPSTVRIDPDHNWLRTLDFERTADELKADLQPGKPFWVRLDAAAALGENRSPQSIEALGAALKSDPFWGIRRGAAQALEALSIPQAWDELLKNTQDLSPHVRTAVATALAKDPRPQTVRSLEKWGEKETSDFVTAEIAFALASQRRETALPFLERLAKRNSLNDVILTRLLEGVASKGWEKGLAMARRIAPYGGPKRARPAAVSAIGSIGSYAEDKRDFLDELTGYMSDRVQAVRAAAAKALGQLGSPAGETILDKTVKTDLDGRVRAAARGGLDSLRAGRDTAPQLKDLRKELGELRQMQEELKRRTEMLEKARSEKKVENTSKNVH